MIATLIRSIYGALLRPQTNGQKLARDFVVIVVGAGLGYLANDSTGVLTTINDATGGKIPAVLLAGGAAGILWAYRAFREWAAKPANAPAETPAQNPPAA